jgi:repressor of nif and glnA expression
MNAGETLQDRSFASVLDDACIKLWDRKVRYTLRRIDELGEILEKTERELDDLLFQDRGA